MFTCAGFQARLFKVVLGFTVALLALSTQAQQENGATPPVAPSASSPNQRTEDPALLAAMRQKDWPRALQLLDAQLTARPNDALSHYRRGEVLTHLDRREDALLAFERSVQLAPRAELAWIELCWQQMLAGRPGQARAACERSVALEKTHITTLNLGHTYLLQGDAETAHQWYPETMSLVESQQQLGDGPVANLDLFIARGWQVESSWPQWQRMQGLTDQVTRLFKEGKYIAARNAAQESLGLSEQLFGPDHSATGVSVNGLTQVHRALGEPAQALPLQQQALAIAEKTQGSAHPDTGLRLNNLAFIHKDKGEFAQALPLFQRALAISENAEGAEHLTTSTRLNNLALLYKDMGEYAQALPLLQHSLAICEKTLGPEHPSTGTTMNNLGSVYEHMGQYAQALLSVSDSGIGIIVATPRGSFGRFRAVKRDELNRQIVALRQAILDHADTRPAAQALWQMLIAPVQADLQASGARTLGLSLTDTLRYLPFAALQDPQGRYLMQDYALSLWAAAARDIDPRPDRRDWQVAGFGVTHAHPGYTALPAVLTELHSIVRTDTNPVGLLPGRIALDEAFSLDQFNAALRGRTNVLHVASHFTFRPGDEHGSGLMLGNGSLLSLAELATKDFSRLDQFTLSACNTATGGGVNENGAEVEGLAATVLREGRARAVMVTLWKVADDSTAQLMRSFYSLRAQAQPLSRAQALRQAQLTMLAGTPRPNPASSRIPDADRQASRLGHLAPDTGVQPVDPARPFAHPYFWVPFVLTGSWL